MREPFGAEWGPLYRAPRSDSSEKNPDREYERERAKARGEVLDSLTWSEAQKPSITEILAEGSN